MSKTTLLQKAKELNMSRRNCMKTKQELEKAIKDTIIKYKDIIFSTDSPIFIKCLDELRKQQVIDEKVYDQKFMDAAVRKLAWKHLRENTVLNGDTLIDKRTGEVLESEVDYTRWKDKF